MNFLKTLAIPGILLTITETSFASSESAFDNNSDSSQENECYNKQILDDVVSGSFFEPREFWELPDKEKMLFFADIVTSLKLKEIVLDHWISPLLSFFVAPDGIEPYSEADEEKVRNAVWIKLEDFMKYKKTKLSKDDFIESLTRNIPDYHDMSKTPLLCYFASFLVPQIDKETYKELPSKFEEWLMEDEKLDLSH